jgi:hypothetical protein
MNVRQRTLTTGTRNDAEAMRMDLRIINNYEPANYALDLHETQNVMHHVNRRCNNILKFLLELINTL